MKSIAAILLLALIPSTGYGQWDVGGSCSPQTTTTVQVGSTRTSVTINKVPMICRIQTQDNSLGSGAWCYSPVTKQYAILTAWHVVSGCPRSKVDIYFPATGFRCKGKVHKFYKEHDVCSIIPETTPNVKPIRVSTVDVKIGESLNCAGLGGKPRKGFLCWRGRTIQRYKYRSHFKDYQATAVTVSKACSQGDSGGPVWNSTGRLVGVITADESKTNVTVITTGMVRRKCRLFHMLFPCKKPPQTQVRVETSQPIYEYQAPCPDPPPVDPIPDTPPVDPPVICPPQQVSVDYERIINEVYAKMEENADKFRGPAGANGADGAMGPPGQDGQITAEHLAAISQALKNDQEFIAKTTGPPGRDGTPADVNALATEVLAILRTNQEIEPNWSHLVVVASQEAEYWDRLNSQIDKAQDYYHRLRVIEPPDDKDIGPLPVMVAYNKGKPIRDWSGYRNVTDALHRITRGDFDDDIKTPGEDDS